MISVHTSFSIAVTQIFSFLTAAESYTILEQGFTTWVAMTFCLDNSFWGGGGVGAEHTQVQVIPSKMFPNCLILMESKSVCPENSNLSTGVVFKCHVILRQ